MEQNITPMLAVHDAAAAISFYEKAFGAVPEGEVHPWEGKIGHAELRFGGAKLMLSDEFPAHNVSPKSLGGSPVILHLTVRDVDAASARAEELGAAILRPPQDQPYGRICKLRDPFGHVWMLNQPVA